MDKLNKFLEENNLEIVPKVVITKTNIASVIKPDVFNFFIQCIGAEYEVKEKEKPNKKK